MFKALGDPTRLSIYRFLQSCCCPVAVGEEAEVRPATKVGQEGPTVGEVCCRVTGADKITSTVSFHLKELRNAGLVTMERRGKNMICGIDRDALRKLAAFLDDPRENGGECC